MKSVEIECMLLWDYHIRSYPLTMPMPMSFVYNSSLDLVLFLCRYVYVCVYITELTHSNKDYMFNVRTLNNNA